MRRRRSISGLLIIFVLLLAGSPWAVRWIQRTLLAREVSLRMEREVAVPFTGNWAILPGHGGVFLLRNAEIRYFHPQQENDWAFGTEALVPVAAANDEHVFLLEASPRYLLRINDQGHMLYQQAANRNAESMRVCRDNHLLLQHPPENRLTPFSVLDPEGRVMGSILLPEGEVLGSHIDSEVNRVFISVLRSTGDSFETVLLGYDLQGVLLTSISFPEQIVMDIAVTDSGQIALLTNQALQLLNLQMEETWRLPVEPFYLSRHDGSDTWVLGHRQESYQETLPADIGGETVLTVIDLKEQTSRVILDPDEIIDLTVRNHHLLVRSHRIIRLYQDSGNLVDERRFQEDLLDAFLLGDQQLAILRRGQIIFYQLEAKQGE